MWERGQRMRKVLISFQHSQKLTLENLQQDLSLTDSEIDKQFGILEPMEHHYAILIAEPAVARTKKLIREKYSTAWARLSELLD